MPVFKIFGIRMRIFKFIIAFSFLVSSSVFAQSDNVLRLQVIDPYADVHSGPGRGYPVLYAIEEGEYVDILARRPGWYEVRAQNGRVGWVTSSQISRTIQVSGEPADLPTVSFGDYLKNSWRVGLSSGAFTGGQLDGSDIWSATMGYRAISWLGLELEYGKFFRDEMKGKLYAFNMLIEPVSKWRLSPYVLLGAGSIDIEAQPKFVPLDVQSSEFQNYGIGTNYYLGRNFLIKIEYRSYSISTEKDNVGSGAWKIGFNTFF